MSEMGDKACAQLPKECMLPGLGAQHTAHKRMLALHRLGMMPACCAAARD